MKETVVRIIHLSSYRWHVLLTISGPFTAAEEGLELVKVCLCNLRNSRLNRFIRQSFPSSNYQYLRLWYRISVWLRWVSRHPVEPRGCRQKCDAKVCARTQPLTDLTFGHSTETDTNTHVPPSRSVLHDLNVSTIATSLILSKELIFIIINCSSVIYILLYLNSLGFATPFYLSISV